MIKKNLKIIFITVVFLSLVSPNFAQQQQDVEEITVTSYYPAPFASYDKLTIDNKLGIGTANPADLLHLYSTSDDTRSVIIDAQGTQSSQQASLEFLSLGDGSKTLGVAGTQGWSIFTRGDAWSTAQEQNDLGLSYWDGSAWINALGIDSATGNIGIGTATPAAKLEISSTTSGFLPPRMTTAQRNAITSPPTGSVIYNTTTNSLEVYNGSSWQGQGGGVENLRIIRGSVNYDGSRLFGSGFTSMKQDTGRYQINFDTAFTDMPSVTVSPVHGQLYNGNGRYNKTTSSLIFEVVGWNGVYVDTRFDFIAVGPE